jgi:hypothetical protein
MLNTSFSAWPSFTQEEADAVSRVVLSQGNLLSHVILFGNNREVILRHAMSVAGDVSKSCDLFSVVLTDASVTH